MVMGCLFLDEGFLRLRRQMNVQPARASPASSPVVAMA